MAQQGDPDHAGAGVGGDDGTDLGHLAAAHPVAESLRERGAQRLGPAGAPRCCTATSTSESRASSTARSARRARPRLAVRTFSRSTTSPRTMCRIGLTDSAVPSRAEAALMRPAAAEELQRVDVEQGAGAPGRGERGRPYLGQVLTGVGRLPGLHGDEPQGHPGGRRVDHRDPLAEVGRGEQGRLVRAGQRGTKGAPRLRRRRPHRAAAGRPPRTRPAPDGRWSPTRGAPPAPGRRRRGRRPRPPDRRGRRSPP